MSVAPIRVKTVYSASGSSKTVTFDEPTALDSSHLLVLSIHAASGTSATTPSGWTAISANGVTGTTQTRMYARQGDGTINGVTIATPNVTGTLTLMAFSGFVSTTPLAAVGLNGSSSTSRSIPTGSADGYGVAISAIGMAGNVTWGNWTYGTRATAIVNATQRLDVAWSVYDDGPGTGLVTHTASWSGSVQQRYMSVIFPLLPPVNPEPLMAFAFDENSGTNAIDSIGSASFEVGAWAPGRVNYGVVNAGGEAGFYPHGPSATSTEWTYMAWAKVNSTSSSAVRQLLLAHDPDQVDDNIIHIELDGSGMLKVVVLRDGTWSGLFSLDVGTFTTDWTHFAIVRHMQGVQVYINGWPEVYIPNAYSTSPQNLELMGFGLAANWSNNDTVYGDDFRIFDKALSRAQISEFSNTPVTPSGPVATPDLPTPVGSTNATFIGNSGGTLAPGLPAGAESYIALVIRDSDGVNAPAGWTLLHEYVPSTRYTVWHANAPVSPPVWNVGTEGASGDPYSAIIVGYDRKTEVTDFAASENNPISPSITTSQQGTVTRITIDGNDADAAIGFPSNAPLGRYEHSPYAQTWSSSVAVAHAYQQTPGSTGTATWGIAAEWMALSATFLLTGPSDSGDITVHQRRSAFNTTANTSTVNVTGVTVPADENRMLIVGIGFNNDNYETISSVVLNPGGSQQSFSEIAPPFIEDDDCYIAFYGLVAPPTGTHSVRVTLNSALSTGDDGFTVFVWSLSGVHQTAYLRSSNGDAGLATSYTATTSTQAGDLVLSVAFAENNVEEALNMSVSPGTTTMRLDAPGADLGDTGFASEFVATSGSTSIVASHQGDEFVAGGIMSIALAPVGAPGSAPIEAQFVSESFPTGTGDIADGVVIIPDRTNAGNFSAIVTRKEVGGGLYVLDSTGQILSSNLDGAANSVDYRDFNGNATWDNRILVLGVDRTNNRIRYYWQNPSTKALSSAGMTNLAYEPYGSSLYIHSNGNVYAFISDRGADDTGTHYVRQYQLTRSGSTVSAGAVVRTFTQEGVMEGIAADDRSGFVYVSREDHGLYRYEASPSGSTTATAVDTVGAGNLIADVEDVAIAYFATGTKILVSSQGDSTFHVYDATTLEHEQKFTVARPGGSPLVGGTDGLDVRIANLGSTFPNGLIVVHDGDRTPISNFAFIDAAEVFGPNEAPSNLPIAAYNFNENTGNSTGDSSGNAYTLMTSGSEEDTWVSNGRTGSGGGVSSNSHFTRTGGFGTGTLTDWTFMTWYRPNGATPSPYGQFIFDSENLWAEITATNHVGFSGAYSTDAIANNVWSHITFVGAGSTVKVYVNGLLVATSTGWSQAGFDRSASYTVGTGGDGPLNGAIDDTRLFSGALTANEIAYWMNTPVSDTSNPQPIAAYGFHETSGTTIADSSGNNNTLTIGSGHLDGGAYTSEGEDSPGAYRLSFNNPTVEGTIMGHVTPGTDQFLNSEESLFGFWSDDGDPAGSTFFALWRNRTTFGGSSGLQGNVRIAGTLHEIATSEVLLPGQVYHVALSFGPAGTRVYIDGVEVAVYAGLTGPLNGGGQFSLGADNDATVFDDVRVFDKQLTQTQINTWKDTAVTPPGPGETPTQSVIWRGRAGGITVTYVRAAVRIGGQTVPLVNGAMRLAGGTVPLKLSSTAASPFDVLGSSSIGRVGSGSITVPMPSGTGGTVLLFLSGNQLSEPSIPAGWTKVNWSTANPVLATGIYQRTAPSGNPTFNVTQSLDGGIAAVAFRVRGAIGGISALGASDVLVSPSTTTSAQSLVVRTIVSSLSEPIETLLSFPPGTHNQQNILIGGEEAGTMVAGAISGVVAAASATGTATWILNNVDTSRAVTWVVEIT